MVHPKDLSFILALALIGCNSPIANMSFVAPDQRHWVAMESIPPSPEKDELLPTLRLGLKAKFSRGPVILEGLETLCGTHILWQDPSTLLIRISADRAAALRVREGDQWQGIAIHVQVHEEHVKWDRWSPDGERRLVVIAECESENWNLYLRRVGEPTYNEAMKSGWDDPDLFGGFEGTQPPIDLKWISSRSAEIWIPGKSFGVTLKEHVGDVRVAWRFSRNRIVPRAAFQSIAPSH